MLPDIEKIKGVHPGAVLARELKKRGIGSSVFAREIGEYPGVITDITKLRRGISPRLGVKIDRKLGSWDGYFLILQAYYDLEAELKRLSALLPKPDLSKIRRSTFWEIDFDSIKHLDFDRYSSYIIKRIFERGNEAEIQEIIRFYGKEKCREVIRTARNLFYAAAENAVKYLKLDKNEIKCMRNSNGTQYQSPWLRS